MVRNNQEKLILESKLAKIFEPVTYNINRSIYLPSTKKKCIHISDMIFLFVQQKILLNYSVIMLKIASQNHKKVNLHFFLYEDVIHLFLFEGE